MDHTVITWDPRELAILDIHLRSWQVHTLYAGYRFGKESGSL